MDAPPGAAFNFLITATAVSPDGRLLVFRAGGGERPPVLSGLLAAAGPAGGTLLLVRDRALLAQAFDVRARNLDGDPVPLAEDIAMHTSLQAAAFWPSDTPSCWTGRRS